MTAEIMLVGAAAAVYVAAAVIAVRQLVRGEPANEYRLLALVSLAAVCLGAVLTARGLRTGRIPAFGVFEVLVWYGLAVTLAYLALAFRHRTRGIPGILLPAVAAVVLASLPALRAPVVPVDSQILSFWLGLHVVTAFLGYGLFTLESVLAVAYLIQDRNLKRKHFGALFQRLPSLETLDHLMYEQIGLAFLLFSFSMALGVVLVRRCGWGITWATDPKVAGAAATWLVYAILFHLRLGADRHGRRMALVALIGLACVIITFIGVHLVAPSVHDFFLPGQGLRSGP
jgi:ABC-type transport system involved in cytochrome c biogenesis permease subunit